MKENYRKIFLLSIGLIVITILTPFSLSNNLYPNSIPEGCRKIISSNPELLPSFVCDNLTNDFWSFFIIGNLIIIIPLVLFILYESIMIKKEKKKD